MLWETSVNIWRLWRGSSFNTVIKKKSRDKHEVLGGLDTNKNPSICERGGDWRECQFWIKERWGFKVSIFTISSTSKIVRTIAFYFKTI